MELDGDLLAAVKRLREIQHRYPKAACLCSSREELTLACLHCMDRVSLGVSEISYDGPNGAGRIVSAGRGGGLSYGRDIDLD